jgi:hypothetical protein
MRRGFSLYKRHNLKGVWGLHVCNGLNIHTRTLVLHACMDYRHWVAFSEGHKILPSIYLVAQLPISAVDMLQVVT